MLKCTGNIFFKVFLFVVDGHNFQAVKRLVFVNVSNVYFIGFYLDACFIAFDKRNLHTLGVVDFKSHFPARFIHKVF